jgi:hypothetical protein
VGSVSSFVTLVLRLSPVLYPHSAWLWNSGRPLVVGLPSDILAMPSRALLLSRQDNGPGYPSSTEGSALKGSRNAYSGKDCADIDMGMNFVYCSKSITRILIHSLSNGIGDDETELLRDTAKDKRAAFDPWWYIGAEGFCDNMLLASDPQFRFCRQIGDIIVIQRGEGEIRAVGKHVSIHDTQIALCVGG